MASSNIATASSYALRQYQTGCILLHPTAAQILLRREIRTRGYGGVGGSVGGSVGDSGPERRRAHCPCCSRSRLGAALGSLLLVAPYTISVPARWYHHTLGQYRTSQ
eukprot:2559805-Rhodomonas_salina.1